MHGKGKAQNEKFLYTAHVNSTAPFFGFAEKAENKCSEVTGFMLSFAESYDPLWYARVKKYSASIGITNSTNCRDSSLGTQVPGYSNSSIQIPKYSGILENFVKPHDEYLETARPVSLYSVINGFWINQTGGLDITIEYGPQKWFYTGAVILIMTLIAFIYYLVYNWHKNKRPKKWKVIALNRRNRKYG